MHFCKIISRNPSRQVYSDDLHRLSRYSPGGSGAPPDRSDTHLASVNDMISQDESLVGRMVYVARQLANQFGIDQTGYRLIINTGPNAGQAVYHLHLHLIGGQRMRFPMG
jgi:histidine triad (HIT) family protein